MKNIAITILVSVIIIVAAILAVCFQVRETEFALVTRFGKPVRTFVKPGFQFRWPAPIERVHKFDARMRLFEAEPGETTTKGAVPIIVNTFVVWKIADPLQFFNAVGTVEQAESKLRSQVSDTQNKIIGQHDFADFVNSDPAKIRFEQIQSEMLADINEPALNNYGIEIVAVGIKQLKVSEDTTEDVFARMRAERKRKTEATIAEGNAEAARIKSEADAKKTELIAAAEARAKAIMGQGDAEAAQHYKLLEQDPDFAIFLRDLDTLKKVLKERATLIFSGETEPFDLLQKIPDIEPAPVKEPQ